MCKLFHDLVSPVFYERNEFLLKNLSIWIKFIIRIPLPTTKHSLDIAFFIFRFITLCGGRKNLLREGNTKEKEAKEIN